MPWLIKAGTGKAFANWQALSDFLITGQANGESESVASESYGSYNMGKTMFSFQGIQRRPVKCAQRSKICM